MKYLFLLISMSGTLCFAQSLELGVALGTTRHIGAANTPYSYYLTNTFSVSTYDSLSGSYEYDDEVVGNVRYNKYFALEYGLPSIDLGYKFRNQSKVNLRYNVSYTTPRLIRHSENTSFMNDLLKGGKDDGGLGSFGYQRQYFYMAPFISQHLSVLFHKPLLKRRNIQVDGIVSCRHSFKPIQVLYDAGEAVHFQPGSTDSLELDFGQSHLENWRGLTTFSAGIGVQYKSIGFELIHGFNLFSPEPGATPFFGRIYSTQFNATYKLYSKPLPSINTAKDNLGVLSFKKQKARLQLLAQFSLLELGKFKGIYVAQLNSTAIRVVNKPTINYLPSLGLSYSKSINKNWFKEAQLELTMMKFTYRNFTIATSSYVPNYYPTVVPTYLNEIDEDHMFYRIGTRFGLSRVIMNTKFGLLLIGGKLGVDYFLSSYWSTEPYTTNSGNSYDRLLRFPVLNNKLNYSGALCVEYNRNGYGIALQFNNSFRDFYSLDALSLYNRNLLCVLKIPIAKL